MFRRLGGSRTLLTGDVDVAEDIAHEAFVRVAGRAAGLRSPDAFASYLGTTVVNLCRSHWRRRRKERNMREREGASVVQRQVVGPSDVDGRNEMLWALRQLPERQRAAIVLRYFEDLTERQTAEVLGCPLGTVKSLVVRGMDALRARLLGVEE